MLVRKEQTVRTALMLTTGLILAGLAACEQDRDKVAMAETCEEMMADNPDMMRGMMGSMMADSAMRGQMMERMMEDPEMRRMMMERMMADPEAHQEMREMMGGMPGMGGMEGMGGKERDTAR
jgi:hypothetical protein